MPPFAVWSCTDAPETRVQVQVIAPYPGQNPKVVANMAYLEAVLRRRFPPDERLFHHYFDAEDRSTRNPKLEEKVGMKCVYSIAFSENSMIVKVKLLVLVVNDSTQKIFISQTIKGGSDDTEARHLLKGRDPNNLYETFLDFLPGTDVRMTNAFNMWITNCFLCPTDEDGTCEHIGGYKDLSVAVTADAPTPNSDDMDPDSSLAQALDYYTELLKKPEAELTDAEKKYIGNSSATLKRLVVIGRDIADKTKELENLGTAAFADENEASCQLATEEAARKREEKAAKDNKTKKFKVLGANTFADEKQAREMIARAKEASCQPLSEEEARKQEEKAEKARKKNARRRASKKQKQAALALVALSQAADADEAGREDAKDVATPRPDSKLEPVRDASRPTTSAQSGAWEAQPNFTSEQSQPPEVEEARPSLGQEEVSPPSISQDGMAPLDDNTGGNGAQAASTSRSEEPRPTSATGRDWPRHPRCLPMIFPRPLQVSTNNPCVFCMSRPGGCGICCHLPLEGLPNDTPTLSTDRSVSLLERLCVLCFNSEGGCELCDERRGGRRPPVHRPGVRF